MGEIVALTHCLKPYVSRTQLPQLRHIVLAQLCMTGRVTMLGLPRWMEGGGRYRTVQRWFHTPLDWGYAAVGRVVRVHLLEPGGEYLLAGDEGW